MYSRVANYLNRFKALHRITETQEILDLIEWWWGYKFPQIVANDECPPLQIPWPLMHSYQEFRTWSHRHAALIQTNGLKDAIRQSLEAVEIARRWRPNEDLLT